MAWSFDEVWEALTGEETSVQTDGRVLESVEVEPQRSGKNRLFVALPLEGRDGHDYVADVFQHGAAAAIVERDPGGCDRSVSALAGRRPRPWPRQPFCIRVDSTLEALRALGRFRRREFQPQIISVSGRSGASAATEMIAAVLHRSFETAKSPAVYPDAVGVPIALSRIRGDQTRVVLRLIGGGPDELARLWELAEPQVAVLTNIGTSRLEGSDVEQVGKALLEKVRSLPSDGGLLLNGDDPAAEAMAAASPAPVVRFGLGDGCDIRASQIESRGMEGVKFRLRSGRQDLYLKIPLLGHLSVHTALAAAAVGRTQDMAWEQIVQGLQTVPEQLRLLSLPGIKDSTVIDDTYDASPTSTLAALNLLEKLEGRRIAVLGALIGPDSAEESGHRLVGHRAAEVADRLVTVGPRARAIVDGAQTAGLATHAIEAVDGSAQAIDVLGQLVAPGDYILVKGSPAIEMEEIVDKLRAAGGGGGRGPWPPL